MIKNSIRVFIVLCSVVAAVLLPKRSYITYLPVTLFSSVVLMFEVFYFTVHKLWKVKGGVSAMVCDAIIFMLGPYVFANFWVFHLSKGKILLYTLINLIADWIFAFPLITLLKKLQFFKLNTSSAQLFTLFSLNAFMNFIFNTIYEKWIAPKQILSYQEYNDTDLI
ncbi:hypothetical protein RGU12_23090 [Fredinandcohnia sp. QZ13]|uniref:hypothetical protein n=1 Tax=Fredinandcohnia sp. QZ13 TaxID=3073144 RepID=UPI002853555D|nr:hypothetical protein [Fredinandcohnia sp. QZ13]MDR4890392.1 hypothetical protein [Fredinandcohnia sp. QZ13]